jgi:hypothetical protein
MRLVFSVGSLLIVFALGMYFYTQLLIFDEGEKASTTVDGEVAPATPIDAIEDALEVKALIEGR